MIAFILNINLLNLSWIIKCLFLRNMGPLSMQCGNWVEYCNIQIIFNLDILAVDETTKSC